MESFFVRLGIERDKMRLKCCIYYVLEKLFISCYLHTKHEESCYNGIMEKHINKRISQNEQARYKKETVRLIIPIEGIDWAYRYELCRRSCVSH